MKPEITTRVARADWGENRFLGHGVIGELAGTESLGGALLLAVTGRRFTPEVAAVVDDIAVCTIAAEPRIWPLKISRIAASYGGHLAGYVAGQVILEGAMVGPWSTGLAAKFLRDLASTLGGESWTPDDVTRLVEQGLAAGQRFPGYGVAFRPLDERVGALEVLLKRRGRTGGHFWRLMRAVESALMKHKHLPANIGAADAAAALDLGMQENEIAMLVTACTSLSFIPNVLEAAAQRAPALRRLPDGCIRYVGAQPRSSARAVAHGKRLVDSKAPVLAEPAYR